MKLHYLLLTFSDAGKPKIQSFSFQDNIVEGSIVSVTCFAISKTKPISFHWLKNVDKITGIEENVRINTASEVSTLVLDPVTMKDNGNYTCSASNIHGSEKFTTELQVKGKFLSSIV